MPKPLVLRPLCREARERVAPDGQIEIPFDVAAMLHEVAFLVEAGVTSVAICFLHAYANPVRERLAAEAIKQKFPKLSITLS